MNERKEKCQNVHLVDSDCGGKVMCSTFDCNLNLFLLLIIFNLDEVCKLDTSTCEFL